MLKIVLVLSLQFATLEFRFSLMKGTKSDWNDCVSAHTLTQLLVIKLHGWSSHISLWYTTCNNLSGKSRSKIPSVWNNPPASCRLQRAKKILNWLSISSNCSGQKYFPEICLRWPNVCNGEFNNEVSGHTCISPVSFCRHLWNSKDQLPYYNSHLLYICLSCD